MISSCQLSNKEPATVNTSHLKGISVSVCLGSYLLFLSSRQSTYLVVQIWAYFRVSLERRSHPLRGCVSL